MFQLSEKFHEQFSSVRQQYNIWKPFEQLYAIIELTRTLQPSYRYFLSQFYENQIHYDNSDIFNHTVEEANTPDLLACRRSIALERILVTLQLYLPLISNRNFSSDLLNVYRDILVQFDSKLTSTRHFSYTEQQLLTISQQIYFFIQTNPNLQKLLTDLPHLVHFVQRRTFLSNDSSTNTHRPLQAYPSLRSESAIVVNAPLMTCSSEGSQVPALSQQLKHHGIDDSGVDLSEAEINNSMQNFLVAQQHAIVGRSQSGNSNRINAHSIVTETVSAPIPEQRPVHIPLMAVFSAPSHFDYRQRISTRPSMQVNNTLAKSDEEEEDKSEEISVRKDFPIESSNDHNNGQSKFLRPFASLRHRPLTKSIAAGKDVSQYLDIDSNVQPMKNTFVMPNTGMKDVPKWLKNLRLHKYDVFFSQMTYDEMMSLTIEKLKELHITDGACTKILLNIKKLKERANYLQQATNDFERGQIDLSALVQHLNELMSTPIRAKSSNQENSDEDDLPKLIMQTLEIVYQKLTPTTQVELANHLLGLFDRCYRHEAFTDDQRKFILQWRRQLSATLQKLGRIEFKTISGMSNHSIQSRRPFTKTPMRNLKSSPAMHHSNSYSIPLNSFASEPQSLMETNFNRRSGKSPPLNYSTNEENNETNLSTAFTPMNSTPQRHTGAYLANNQYQTLSRKASIHPYGESQVNKTKLCKTLSEPPKIRFYNPPQMQPIPLTGFQSHQINYQMQSTPYSQTYSVSPKSNDDTDHDLTDEQRQSNSEFDSFCRQITESAMSDDAVEHHQTNPSSTSSAESEQ